MRKRSRQLIGVLMASAMVISTNVVIPNEYTYAQEDTSSIKSSGTYGNNITWTLQDGMLTVSGFGKLEKIDNSDFPWTGNDEIKKLNINKGITDIGNQVFYNLGNLQDVNFSDGLKSIGDWAFTNCDIRRLRIPDSVESIGECAFGGNSYLKKLVLPSNLKEIGVDAFSILNGGCMYLTGNAPKIEDENYVDIPGAVSGRKLTIIYPKDNKTYTEQFKNHFTQSEVNWVEEDVKDMSLDIDEGDDKVESVTLDVQGTTIETNDENRGKCNISINIKNYSGSVPSTSYVYVYLKSERDDSESKLMASYNDKTGSYELNMSDLYGTIGEFTWTYFSGKTWIEKIEIQSDSGKRKPAGNNSWYVIPVSSYGVVSNGSNPYVAEKPEDAKYWFNIHRTYSMTFYEPDLSVKSLKDNGGEIYKEEKTIAVEDGISAIGMNDVYKAKDLGDLKFKRWYCPFFDYMEDEELYDCSCVLYSEYDKDILVFDVKFDDGNDEVVDIKTINYDELDEDDLPVVEGYENYKWRVVRDTGAIYYIMDVDGNKPDKPLKIKNASTLSKDKIEAAVKDISNAAEKTNVSVEMNNATVIPNEILKAEQGKNVNVTFNTAYSAWSINGKTIVSDNIEDANISLTKEAGSVSNSNLSDLIGKRSAEKIIFGNNDSFGFKADRNLKTEIDITNNKAVLIQKNETGYVYKSSSSVSNNNYSINVDNGNESYVIYGDNGDLNSDSKIDIRDAMSCLRHVSGREDLDCVREGFADVNFDGNVNIQDLIKEIHVVSGRDDNF